MGDFLDNTTSPLRLVHVVSEDRPGSRVGLRVGAKRKPDLSFDSSWSLEDEDWILFHPPSTKRIRRQSSKSVRFAQTEQVSYRHLSKEDLANAWYKPTDWQGFKKECRETVSAIIKANGDLSCMDHGMYCIHGLERLLDCFFRQSRSSSRQRTIVRQVILVQQWQREKGVEDQAALKNAYLKLSRKHRTRAIRRASFDGYTPASDAAFFVPPTHGM